jgi:hydroxymethylpyrimidine pyrophosphatase-like HAD family hydrolase
VITTGTVAHDGQLDEETVAEPIRLADIGRKLLLVTGRELGDLLEVFLTTGTVRAGRG